MAKSLEEQVRVGQGGYIKKLQAEPPREYAGPGGKYIEEPGDTGEYGAGGGGAGGGVPPPPPTAAPPPYVDIGIPGLPVDIQATIDRMFQEGRTADEVLRWLRTTPWYAQEYAGIEYGINNGYFSTDRPEADYRAWKNKVQQISRQYYGKDASTLDIVEMLRQGYSIEAIEQRGAGHAYAVANRGELQYLAGAFGEGQVSDENLDVYGAQVKGYETEMGNKLRNSFEQAMARVTRVFQGEIGSGAALGESLGETKRRRFADTGA